MFFLFKGLESEFIHSLTNFFKCTIDSILNEKIGFTNEMQTGENLFYLFKVRK